MIISFSIDLGLCALSRHRCWGVFLCFVVDKKVLETAVGRLITALSSTSVTTFVSCVLAGVRTAESGNTIFIS